MGLGLSLGLGLGAGRASGGGGIPYPTAALAAYNPAVLSSLWQDTAGTTPVTADGDPVGRIDDLSGNGNHLLQGTADARPLYRTSGGMCWLELDGVNDGFTCTLSSPLTEAGYLGAGVELSDNGLASGTLVELAATPRNDSLVGIITTSAPGIRQQIRTTTLTAVLISTTTSYMDTAAVFSSKLTSGDISNRIDGAEVGTATDAWPAADLATLTVGTGSTPAQGKLYGFAIYDETVSDAQIAALDAWLAGLSGVTL